MEAFDIVCMIGVPALVGVCIGILSGLLGIGGGTIMVLSLIHISEPTRH